MAAKEKGQRAPFSYKCTIVGRVKASIFDVLRVYEEVLGWLE